MRFAALLLLVGLSSFADAEPSIECRFVFLGCNRVGFTELDRNHPSSANRVQLLAAFDEVLALEPRPSHFFLVGDLVCGYNPDPKVIEVQLQAWMELYSGHPLAQSEIVTVPIVGNHEVLYSKRDPVTGAWVDYPQPETLDLWNRIMKPLLQWGDGPTTEEPNADLLTHDQHRLSFTVRYRNLLFVALNTDTFIDRVTIGDVPIHWLSAQLDRADRDPSLEHVFVLGHKPLERPGIPGWIIREGERQTMTRLLASSSKVRAFLTSHYHLWDHRHLSSGVPQVIAGNAGTAPSGQFNDEGKGYYGFTVVDLLDNGEIVASSWGRPIPEPYDSQEPQPPATLREKVRLKRNVPVLPGR